MDYLTSNRYIRRCNEAGSRRSTDTFADLMQQIEWVSPAGYIAEVG